MYLSKNVILNRKNGVERDTLILFVELSYESGHRNVEIQNENGDTIFQFTPTYYEPSGDSTMLLNRSTDEHIELASAVLDIDGNIYTNESHGIKMNISL